MNEDKKPAVHFHEDSRLHYLLGKDKVLFENGVTMTREKFNRVKDTHGKVLELATASIEEHDTEHTGYDWPFACSTGTLRRKNVSMEPPAPKAARKRRKKTTVAAVVKQEEQKKEAAVTVVVKQEEQKKRTLRRWIFSSVFLVMAVMAIVGIGSAIMSAYHTSAFLVQGGKPAWAAIMTGTMLILFSGTAFTAARYFLQEKGLQRSFGFLFIIAGFMVIAYSIFSTVTVNYNQFKWVDDAKTVAVVEDSELLAAHERLLIENQEALDDTGKRLERLETESGYWRNRSWKRYDEFQAQIIVLQEERKELRNQRVRLESSRPELVAQAADSQETVYTFLARLLGLPEDIARFFVYVIPACLYDILAPFALSVVLLLVDRRRKDAVEG